MRRCGLTAVLMLISLASFAITLNVAMDGSGDYTLIQAALDAAQPGDSVLAHPGRYYENLIISTNNISLISLEAVTDNPLYIDTTVIDGNSTGRCIQIIQNVQNVYIRGFTLTNGLSTGGAGGIALPTNTSSILKNLNIHNNTSAVGGGINIGAATVTLSGVQVHENYALYLGGGLYAAAGGGYLNAITFDPLNRCSIYNNRSGSGQDIFIQNAANDQNIYLDTFSVENPTSYYAIFKTQNNAAYHMNIDILYAHHQEINSDIYISPEGDDSNDGLSPANPLKTIHEGIYRIAADSLNQKTVHLMPGTYSRTANAQVFPIALKSWVIVKGSGIDNTTVIGELNPLITVGDIPCNDVFFSNYQKTVSLSQISITTQYSSNDTVLLGDSFGSVNLSDLHIYNVNPKDLSVIWLYLSSDYESRWDNVLIENVTTTKRGLVDIGGSMKGTISNSIFRNATSTFTSSSVWAYPLVSFMGDDYLRFDNCEFSNLTMSDDDSRAIQVGGVQFPQQQNNFSFNNCLFSNNTSQGGVMTVSSANNPSINVTNCTFAGNESNTYTLATNGNVTVTNTIFDNISPYQIMVVPQTVTGEITTLNIAHSNIKNGMAGIQQAPGNTINFHPTSISSSPLFLGGDDIHNPLYYSLSSASPCIDAGTPDISGLSLLPYDLAGNMRVWNDVIDMGCYEFGAPPVANDDPVIPQLSGGISATNFPNPINPETTIRFHLPVGGLTELGVYNLKGQLVRKLLHSDMTAGTHTVQWDCRDKHNQPVTSGIYLYRIVSGKQQCMGKMVLMK